MRERPTQLQGTRLEHQTIRVARDAGFFLGPELILSECTLLLDGVDDYCFIMSRAHLERCRVVATKPAPRNDYWLSARVVDCTFEGTFIDNRFGWADYTTYEESALIRADFTRATLQACEVLGNTSSGLVMGPWPQMATVEPSRVAEFMGSEDVGDLPDRLRIWLSSYGGLDPDTRLVVEDARDVAKFARVSVAEVEQLATTLRGQGLVHFSYDSPVPLL